MIAATTAEIEDEKDAVFTVTVEDAPAAVAVPVQTGLCGRLLTPAAPQMKLAKVMTSGRERCGLV